MSGRIRTSLARGARDVSISRAATRRALVIVEGAQWIKHKGLKVLASRFWPGQGVFGCELNVPWEHSPNQVLDCLTDLVCKCRYFAKKT